ncbi:MAG: pyridoxamine 5'-phosphate oxidase family protein [Patescibacteria group bacterium]
MPTPQRAKEIIEKIIYVTIASISEDGMPWNAPVFATYDENYNFYWGTNRDSQKAKNIRNNKNVFLVIYDSTVPAGEGEGVYVKATAQEIVDPQEIEFAHSLLQKRRPVPYWKLEEVQGNGPIRLYKAVPEKIWMNDGERVNGTYVDSRKEIEL